MEYKADTRNECPNECRNKRWCECKLHNESIVVSSTVALSDRRIAGIAGSLTSRWRTFDGLWRTVVEPFVRLGQRGLGQKEFCVIRSSSILLDRGLGTSTWMLAVSHCLLLCRVRTREFVPSRIRTSHFHPRYPSPNLHTFAEMITPQRVCNRFDSARYYHSHKQSPSGCR